jgi:Tfp pilus assembly PilM family ATPase
MKISWIQRQWFSRQSTILGGLALSDDAWRWVRGDHFDQEPLQPGWVANGVVVAIEPVSAALKRLWARLEIGPNPPPLQVAMNLPSTAVLLHRVKVPCRLSDQKLLAFCRQHAGDWLPLPLADMVLDVYVDGDSEEVVKILSGLGWLRHVSSEWNRLGYWLRLLD